MQSKYKWQAVYKNGDILSEEKGTGYHDINRDNLCFFNLVNRETSEVKFKIEIREGQNLIWRRRYALTPSKNQEVIVHLVGKQENVDGKNYQWIALFFEEDSRVEFFDKFDPKHPFLDEVELLDFEK